MPPATAIRCDPNKYSAECIAQVAAGAGFNKSEKMLATAVAVALAESSGRTGVVNSIGCCVGLWQINVKVHPYTKEQMQNPAQNAAAAFKISDGGTNWKPWSAYTNGSYLLYMASGTSAAKSSLPVVNDPNGEDSNASASIPSINDMVDSVTAVRDWISDRDNIFRIMKVAAGIVMIAAGVVLVAKPMIGNVAGGVVRTVVKGAK